MFASIGAALASLCCPRHEDIYQVDELRHPVTHDLITQAVYLRCMHCQRRTPGWITKGGVQPSDAPTRWIRILPTRTNGPDRHG
jgi:hypothetical protein